MWVNKILGLPFLSSRWVKSERILSLDTITNFNYTKLKKHHNIQFSYHKRIIWQLIIDENFHFHLISQHHILIYYHCLNKYWLGDRSINIQHHIMKFLIYIISPNQSAEVRWWQHDGTLNHQDELLDQPKIMKIWH